MYNTGNSISTYFLMLNPARWNGSTKREKSQYMVKKCYTFVEVIQWDLRKIHKAATILIAQVQLGSSSMSIYLVTIIYFSIYQYLAKKSILTEIPFQAIFLFFFNIYIISIKIEQQWNNRGRKLGQGKRHFLQLAPNSFFRLSLV